MSRNIQSILLFPYSLYPIDNGAKRESWKILSILKQLGNCTVFSALKKPVGGGWSTIVRNRMEQQNIHIVFREQIQKRRNLLQLIGILYATFFKIMKLEKAFFHNNPYHRYAFPPDIWEKLTRQFELAVISYSYWAWLPTKCPKILILHDLLSDFMWGKSKIETLDLKTADLIIVISKTEEKKLHLRGIRKTHWSPPAIEKLYAHLNDKVGLVGSKNHFNQEGLKWLISVRSNLSVHVYGRISELNLKNNFIAMGSYEDVTKPYRECGVILIPTVQGMGVQIKAVEALASGRAIIARKGAMRGLPYSDQAWLEVNDPKEMLEAADWLSKDKKKRERMGKAAHDYYETYLNSEKIHQNLSIAIKKIVRS